MIKSAKHIIVLTLAIAFVLVSTAHAGVTLAAARIGAVDVAGVAKFYQSAFGMQEIMQLDAALAAPELYARDPEKAASLAKKRSDAARALAQAEENWLAASAAYEDANS